MDYKNLKTYHYLHLSNVKAFTLIQETGMDYGGDVQFKIAMKVKKNIDKCKKSFYNLFDEHTRKELIDLDKKVRKAYDKVMKKTPCLLEDRYTVKIGLDHDDFMVRPDFGKTYQKIYQFKREKDQFVPKTNTKEDSMRHTEEEQILMRYGKELQELAKLLYIQEEYVKLAIESSLRDKRLRDLAIETALYIGYINGYLLDGAKKIIK